MTRRRAETDLSKEVGDFVGYLNDIWSAPQGFSRRETVGSLITTAGVLSNQLKLTGTQEINEGDFDPRNRDTLTEKLVAALGKNRYESLSAFLGNVRTTKREALTTKHPLMAYRNPTQDLLALGKAFADIDKQLGTLQGGMLPGGSVARFLQQEREHVRQVGHQVDVMSRALEVLPDGLSELETILADPNGARATLSEKPADQRDVIEALLAAFGVEEAKWVKGTRSSGQGQRR